MNNLHLYSKIMGFLNPTILNLQNNENKTIVLKPINMKFKSNSVLTWILEEVKHQQDGININPVTIICKVIIKFSIY